MTGQPILKNRLAVVDTFFQNGITCWLEESFHGTSTPIKLLDQSYVIVLGEADMNAMEYCILCEHGFVWASIHNIRFL